MASLCVEMLAFQLDLKILGTSFQRSITVPPGPTRLADVVPTARWLADDLSQLVVRQALAEGCEIPCVKGCAACCRAMVPLSMPEVFCLWDEMLATTSPDRQNLLRAMIAADTKIRQLPPPQYTSRCRDPQYLHELGRWYRELDVDCPFLLGPTCICYTKRPVACRQYFVTSSPQHCGTGSSEGRRLAMPLSMVQALCQLASELMGMEPTAVLLPLAPAWAVHNISLADKAWPAEEVFGHFVKILQTTSLPSLTFPDVA